MQGKKNVKMSNAQALRLICLKSISIAYFVLGRDACVPSGWGRWAWPWWFGLTALNPGLTGLFGLGTQIQNDMLLIT